MKLKKIKNLTIEDFNNSINDEILKEFKMKYQIRRVSLIFVIIFTIIYLIGGFLLGYYERSYPELSQFPISTFLQIIQIISLLIFVFALQDFNKFCKNNSINFNKLKEIRTIK